MTCIRMNDQMGRPSGVRPSLCKSGSKDIGGPERVGTSRHQNNIGPRCLNVYCRRFNVAAESDQALLSVAAIRRQAVDHNDRRGEVITHEKAEGRPGRSRMIAVATRGRLDRRRCLPRPLKSG